jgi:hypothetical protein
MEKKETIYANGFIAKRTEKDPDFIVVRLSIKADEAVEFINKNTKDGWVNLEIKKGKTADKFNVTLNTYQAPKTEHKKQEETKWESPF